MYLFLYLINNAGWLALILALALAAAQRRTSRQKAKMFDNMLGQQQRSYGED